MFDWVKEMLGGVALTSREAAPVHSRLSGDQGSTRGVRRFHLGLDWGTSSTKLVLRDYTQDAAFVVTPEGADDRYRYPSVVHVAKGRIHLGAKARDARRGGGKTIPSLKTMSLTPQFNQRIPDAPGLTGADLSTLFLAHAVNVGWRTAVEIAGRANQSPSMGMTLGVPTEAGWKSFTGSQSFYRMARAAFEIGVNMGVDPQGIELDQAARLLGKAKEVAGGAAAIPSSWDQWLRPELGAAMLWGFKCPAIEPGLYSCVDIGAWTTNASFFRIRHQDIDGEFVEKGGLSFYAGSCRPPGMNEVCERLTSVTGHTSAEHLWGSENKYLRGHGHLARPVVEDFFKTWENGFRRAYRKEARPEPWTKLKVMPVGGGSKVDYVHDRIRQFHHHTWGATRVVPDLGIPSDLYEVPSKGVAATEPFGGDNAFLLVGYGLSVRAGDFPDVHLADAVKPIPKGEVLATNSSRRPPKCTDCGKNYPIPGEFKCRDCI